MREKKRKNYLFFIGGSGARAYTAFLHACAAGVVQTDNAQVVLLDADVTNAACSSCLKTYEAYHLHREMLQGINSPIKAFHCNVVMKDPSVISPLKKLNKSVDYLQQIAEGDTTRERILKWFYIPDEISNDLKEGFYGHPNIGCIFFQNIDVNEKLNAFITSIMEEFRNGNDPRVIVVGSVFGGTGASGIPSIVKLLKKKCKQMQLSFEKLQLCGILITPYFSVPDKGKTDGKLVIHSDDFYNSTKTALHYYEYTDDFKKTYLVGQETLEPVNRKYEDGGQEQDNKPHIVEAVVAMAIRDFLENDSEDRILSCIINRKDKIDWSYFGDEFYPFSDMLRAQMILETEIYPCAIGEEEQPSTMYGIRQWQKVYEDLPSSKQNLKTLQKYSELFLKWMYLLQYKYELLSDNLIPDNRILLCNPQIIKSLNDQAARNDSSYGKPGWRKYQEIFNDVVDTSANIEYVVEKFASLLSALGVGAKGYPALGCAGLFLKLFSLSGHILKDRDQF